VRELKLKLEKFKVGVKDMEEREGEGREEGRRERRERRDKGEDQTTQT
jgi:hypothetical protein